MNLARVITILRSNPVTTAAYVLIAGGIVAAVAATAGVLQIH